MQITKTLYVTKREDWRKWLSKNAKTEKEIWLIYYKISSGKSRIPQDQAVEEALCYGWIDSTMKGIDEEKFAQRFSPRRKTSVLSELNLERVKRLIKSKKMTRLGLKALESHSEKINSSKVELKIAPDILSELKKIIPRGKTFRVFPNITKR
jgi:uncharacterized protein YdeI (YjbR/CyaY-like superfamily)